MVQYRDLEWPDRPKQDKDKADEQANNKQQEEKN